MKQIYLLTLCVMMAVCGSCTNEESYEEYVPVELTRAESEISANINAFAIDFLKAADKIDAADKKNYVLSPISVSWCLSMLANGATPDSKTQRELIDVLNIEDNMSIGILNDYNKKLIEALSRKTKNADVRIANAFFYHNSLGINQEYEDAMMEFFDAKSFENPTNKILDAWISGQTGGKIRGFAEKFNVASSDFGVLNTIYYSGLWANEFDVDNTENSVFHNADGTDSYPLTVNGGQYFGVATTDIIGLVKILMKGDAFAVNFILPQGDYNLDDAIENLNAEVWNHLVSNLKFDDNAVTIPILNLSSDYDLTETLKSMGLECVFGDSAEFDHIGLGKLALSKVNQESLFALDEKGTSFKVVSSGEMSGLANIGVGNPFVLDEPFLFFITEESTGAILISGKVTHL